MSAIDIAKLNPGWQADHRAGVRLYRGVLRTPRGRIVYWTCSDTHAFTATAKACAANHLTTLLEPTDA